MEPAVEQVAIRERIRFLDAARALFMVLGIPFHAALAYSAAHWVISSPDRSALLDALPAEITAFRLPGFFLIAGYFGAMLLEKRGRSQWFRGRLHRLGVPLLAGIALIAPLQNAILRFAGSPAVHMPHRATGIIYSHLWFLPVLLMLCAGLAASWALVSRIRWPNLPVALAGIGFGLWMVAVPGVESVTHINLALVGGLIDLDSVMVYAPMFLLGVAAQRNAAAFERLRRFSWLNALLAVAALAVCSQTWHASSRPGIIVALMASGIAAVCATQLILALLARFADRPSVAVDRLVDASFTIYLLHHPIVIALVLAFVPIAWPPLAEWAVICALTLALSYGLHRFMRRSSLLMFVFNGVPLSRPADLVRRAPARA